MALTVDFTTASPWLITIPKSDLTLESGTKYKLTVDEFWSLLTDYTDNQTTMAYPKLYSRIPATTSTPSITEIEPDYQLQFEDGSYSVNIIEGNTNIRDVEVKNSVSVNTNNTTGFIDPTYIQYSTFSGGVWIDTTNGQSGTTYPTGTPSVPSDNLADTLAIAQANGFNHIYIKGSVTIDSGDWSAGYIFHGQSPVISVVTLGTAAILDNCEIRDAFVQGVLDTGNILRECLLGNITSYSGFMDRCGLNGTITLGSGQTTMVDVFSNIAGGSTPYIDFSGAGSSLAVRGYSGGLGIKNKTGSDQVSIDMDSGQVKFDADVTNTANIYVRGNGRITDNSTGTDLIDSVGLSAGEHTVRGSGFVVVNATRGTAGTNPPQGTEDFPCVNIADAIVVAERNHLTHIKIEGAVSTVGTEDLSMYLVFGDTPVSAQLVVTAGTTTTDTTFKDLTISGTLSSDGAVLERCQVGNLAGMSKYMYQCFLYGTTTIEGNTTMAFCAIAPNAVAQRAYVEFDGGLHTVIVSDWGAGVVCPQGMVTGSFFGASGTGGRIEPQISNTGGQVVLGGSLILNDTYAANLDIVKDSSVAGDVWAKTAGVDLISDVTTQGKVLRNKTETNPVTGVMTVYDDDGISVLFTANIWENIAGTDPYAGNAVNRRERLV